MSVKHNGNAKFFAIDDINVSLNVYCDLVNSIVNKYNPMIELQPSKQPIVYIDEGEITVLAHVKFSFLVEDISKLILSMEKEIYDAIFFLGSVKPKLIMLRVS